MLPQLLALTLAIAPAAVSAGLFPSNSLVKHLDAKGFRQALKENVRTGTHSFPPPFADTPPANERDSLRSTMVWSAYQHSTRSLCSR